MKIIDLTLDINENTPVFPGDPKIEIERQTVQTHGFGKTIIKTNNHVSTHIDAPCHMIKNANTLSDYPIEKFVGEGIVIDAVGQKEINVDLLQVKENDIVFFHTNHIKKLYEKDYFENNPIITKELAQQLVNKKISIIGLDSFTPDNDPYDVHKIFLGNDVLIIENLINLDKLVGKRFQCIVAPLKIKDSDGAPCRVIAILDEK
jgi:kynurenine formamidase